MTDMDSLEWWLLPMGPKVSAIFPQPGVYPPWGLTDPCAKPSAAPPPPDLEPLNDAEAFQLYQDMQQGRFWSESIQDRIAKAKAAGFVFARRRDHGQK